MKHSISAHNSSYHLSSMAVEGDDLAFVLQLQKLCSWKKSMNSVLKYLKVKCEAVSPTAKACTNFFVIQQDNNPKHSSKSTAEWL